MRDALPFTNQQHQSSETHRQTGVGKSDGDQLYISTQSAKLNVKFINSATAVQWTGRAGAEIIRTCQQPSGTKTNPLAGKKNVRVDLCRLRKKNNQLIAEHNSCVTKFRMRTENRTWHGPAAAEQHSTYSLHLRVHFDAYSVDH